MTCMKKQILTALAALLALPGLAQTNFRSITFDEALAAAKAENKMVFIDFYTRRVPAEGGGRLHERKVRLHQA